MIDEGGRTKNIEHPLCTDDSADAKQRRTCTYCLTHYADALEHYFSTNESLPFLSSRSAFNRVVHSSRLFAHYSLTTRSPLTGVP